MEEVEDAELMEDLGNDDGDAAGVVLVLVALTVGGASSGVPTPPKA